MSNTLYHMFSTNCVYLCEAFGTQPIWSRAAPIRHWPALTIGRHWLTLKPILLSYLSHLFRLQLLSEDSYLVEGLQSADKTKTHPKAKLQNAPTFTRNGSHCHVCLLLV